VLTAAISQKNRYLVQLLLEDKRLSIINYDHVKAAIETQCLKMVKLVLHNHLCSIYSVPATLLQLMDLACKTPEKKIIAHLFSLQMVPLKDALYVVYDQARKVSFDDLLLLLNPVMISMPFDDGVQRSERTVANMFKQAIQHFDLNYAKYLVEVLGCNSSRQKSEALRHAVAHCYEITEYLMTIGCDPNSDGGIILAETHHQDILELLLNHPRTDPKAIGQSLLHVCRNGNLDTLQSILKRPKLDRSIDFYFPFSTALKVNQFHIAMALYKQFRVDLTRNNGELLPYIWNSGHTELIEVALDNSMIDPSAFNNQAIITVQDIVMFFFCKNC
jgi:hypothetical protein